MGDTNQIQININPDDPSKGQIVYTMNTNAAPTGIISTAYYFRSTDEGKQQDSQWTKTDIYKKGILQYLKLTDAPEFTGWKVIIYLDMQTLETPIMKDVTAPNYQIHLEEWNTIAKHPNVIFGVVQWPEFSVGNGDGYIMDNAIIRALRMKALMDFPNIPVFIRDADTLFENILKTREIVEDLVKWEFTLKTQLERIDRDTPCQIIIASQPNYHRQWHVNPITGQKTTGCYAGVTSTLGGIQECIDGTLWRKCLKYLLKPDSQIGKGPNGKRTPLNSNKPTYIGKDEQLLSYVFIPNIFDKVYFYYLEYIQVEGTKVIPSDITPFASELNSMGITRYPSPYIKLLGEEFLPLDESAGKKRKDENTITESTILNPASVPLALSTETHNLMQTIFRWYLKNMKTTTGGRMLSLKI